MPFEGISEDSAWKRRSVSGMPYVRKYEVIETKGRSVSGIPYARTSEVIETKGRGLSVSMPTKWAPWQSVNTLSDVTKCYITAICVFSATTILLADNLNKKLKLMINMEMVTFIAMSESPWDICRVALNKVAVAVDYGVHIIKLTNDDLLVNERKLPLKHLCRGIARHVSDLYVSSSTALYRYTLNGKYVGKLYEDTSGPETVYKCAVNPSSEMIYILNRFLHKLITLARDGTVLFTFTDPHLQWPRGLHVTEGGMVLLCGSVSNTIIQIDREGRRKLNTLATSKDGVWTPVPICFDRYNSCIIVCQYDNSIQMIRMSLTRC